jgi:hypothetical protein
VPAATAIGKISVTASSAAAPAFTAKITRGALGVGALVAPGHHSPRV